MPEAAPEVKVRVGSSLPISY